MALSRILIAVCLTMLFIAPCVGISENASAASTVDFTVSVPELGLTGGFAADVDYPVEMQATKGSVADISYSLSAASGSLTIDIPLSMITLGFMADQSVTIPLPKTPIGQMSFPVLQYLVHVPSNLADVSVVLQGAVAAKTVTCSSGSDDVITSLNSLTWTSWGAKSLQVQTHEENPSVSISTTFAYTLGVGIDATFLGTKFTLISPIEFSAVLGTPVASTTVQAVDPFPIALLIIGVIVVAAIVVGFVFYNRSKKGISMPPADNLPQTMQISSQSYPQQIPSPPSPYDPVRPPAVEYQSNAPPIPPIQYGQQSPPVQPQIQEMQVCPYCRKQLQTGWVICGYCGAKLG